jgi:hypothetical protein
MNRKFLQFTIGAASSLVKKFVPCNTEWFIEYTSTSVLTLTAVGAVATVDAVTITFTTADATYASHDAVMNALASANSANSNPTAIIVPALPLVGSTQQLITTVAIA